MRDFIVVLDRELIQGWRRKHFKLTKSPLTDFNKPSSPYNGKLALCPTDNATSDPNIRLSVSHGMVSLYFASHGTWRGLDTKALLGATEANTICRQMGFTGAVPGSATALSATDRTFNKCL